MLTLDDIFRRLEAMGYNQAAIANRLNTSEANVSRWKHSVHVPNPDVIEALAELARLNPATVAVVVMASKSKKSRKGWERAYGDLARAGLATVALAVGLGVAVPSDAEAGAQTTAYYGKRRRRRQEAVPPATRRLSQLSGWLKHNNPLSTIQPIQRRLQRTLRRPCCPPGLPIYRRASRHGTAPTPAWVRA